jgi:hypothetical protein
VEDEVNFVGFVDCHPDCEFIFSAVTQHENSTTTEPT